METIENIENAQTPTDIRGLKKLKGYQTVFRIRIGDYRLGIHILSDTVHSNRIANRKIYTMNSHNLFLKYEV